MVKSLWDGFAKCFGISIVSSVGFECYGWSMGTAMSTLATLWVHDAGRREDRMGQMSKSLRPNATKFPRLNSLVHFDIAAIKSAAK